MLSTLTLHRPAVSSRARVRHLADACRVSYAPATAAPTSTHDQTVSTMSWFGGADGMGANPTTGKPFGNAAKRITTGRLGGMT